MCSLQHPPRAAPASSVYEMQHLKRSIGKQGMKKRLLIASGLAVMFAAVPYLVEAQQRAPAAPAAAAAPTPAAIGPQVAQAPVAPPAGAAATFDAVRQRGSVLCGTNTGLAGFALPNAQGVWTGIDVDVCRAVAAAMFGDATKVR